MLDVVFAITDDTWFIIGLLAFMSIGHYITYNHGHSKEIKMELIRFCEHIEARFLCQFCRAKLPLTNTWEVNEEGHICHDGTRDRKCQNCGKINDVAFEGFKGKPVIMPLIELDLMKQAEEDKATYAAQRQPPQPPA
jgi:hypothetical protein